MWRFDPRWARIRGDWGTRCTKMTCIHEPANKEISQIVYTLKLLRFCIKTRNNLVALPLMAPWRRRCGAYVTDDEDQFSNVDVDVGCVEWICLFSSNTGLSQSIIYFVPDL